MSRRAEIWERKRVAFLQNRKVGGIAADSASASSSVCEDIEHSWNESRKNDPPKPILRQEYKLVDDGVPQRPHDRNRTEIKIAKPPGGGSSMDLSWSASTTNSVAPIVQPKRFNPLTGTPRDVDFPLGGMQKGRGLPRAADKENHAFASNSNVAPPRSNDNMLSTEQHPRMMTTRSNNQATSGRRYLPAPSGTADHGPTVQSSSSSSSVVPSSSLQTGPPLLSTGASTEQLKPSYSMMHQSSNDVNSGTGTEPTPTPIIAQQQLIEQRLPSSRQVSARTGPLRDAALGVLGNVGSRSSSHEMPVSSGSTLGGPSPVAVEASPATSASTMGMSSSSKNVKPLSLISLREPGVYNGGSQPGATEPPQHHRPRFVPQNTPHPPKISVRTPAGAPMSAAHHGQQQGNLQPAAGQPMTSHENEHSVRQASNRSHRGTVADQTGTSMELPTATSSSGRGRSASVMPIPAAPVATVTSHVVAQPAVVVQPQQQSSSTTPNASSSVLRQRKRRDRSPTGKIGFFGDQAEPASLQNSIGHMTSPAGSTIAPPAFGRRPPGGASSILFG
ncbi:unnamed protein product [Amoebophrya sp. A25]|nr:unnamed protein product [Amoebophrya sp. A25]|eukprot:GSA25T00024720001.1